jgi:hypothetical protein
MDARVWRLPGPLAFLREIATELRRGRHVAVVLPTALSANEVFADSLAQALIEQLYAHQLQARRIHPQDQYPSLLDAVSHELVWADDDDHPATVPDLLCHREVAGMVGVAVASDFPDAQRSDFPAFLRRCEQESRAHPEPTDRLSLVSIVNQRDLPSFTGGADTDVAMATIWWWGRIARWDSAAHIVASYSVDGGRDVIEEARIETVVDVARWDLDLAEQLASAWNGEPADLPGHLKAASMCNAADVTRIGDLDAGRPPAKLAEAWNQRLVDRWHGSTSFGAGYLADDIEKLNRIIWGAQARVLLPWIEERRTQLVCRAVEVLGRKRFHEVLERHLALTFSSASALEIGVLDKAIRIGIGRTHPDITEASRRLRASRNALAHLEPLSLSEQSGVVAACRSLA